MRRLALLLLRSEDYAEPEGVGRGWMVPCRVVDCSEADQIRILVTDNPNRDALDYDDAALGELLTELAGAGSLDGTWYTPESLDRLLADMAQYRQEDVEPLPESDEGGPDQGEERQARPVTVKAVFTVEQVGQFEQALRMTGLRNRAQAIVEVFRAYVEGNPERQRNVPAEGQAAP